MYLMAVELEIPDLISKKNLINRKKNNTNSGFGGVGTKQIPWQSLLKMQILLFLVCTYVVNDIFEVISRRFWRGLHFGLPGGKGGMCTKRKPWLKWIKTTNLVAPCSASVKYHVWAYFKWLNRSSFLVIVFFVSTTIWSRQIKEIFSICTIPQKLTEQQLAIAFLFLQCYEFTIIFYEWG